MIEKINELKEILSKYETMDILGYIATKFITFSNNKDDFADNSNIFNKTLLDSPYKQYIYLAGLLMSTDYKKDEDNEEELIEDEINSFEEIERKLKSITDDYMKFFIPEDKSIEELQNLNDMEKKKRQISMQVFLSYFNTDILRYEEQIIERLNLFAKPFDNILVEEIGINVSEFISFYEFIRISFSRSIEESKSGYSKFVQQHQKLMQKVELKSKSNFEEAYEYMLNQAKSFNKENLTKINDVFIVYKSDIIKKYGELKGNKLIELFSLQRKSRDFLYYNKNNIFEEKPLCWIDEYRLFIVNPKIVLSAIYKYVISFLEELDNKNKIKYYEARGNKTEELTLNLFRKIFGEEAKYYKSVCEIYGSEEHDLLIEYEGELFIIEIKSSKTKAPLFNPDKAYKRIVDHFNSKSGIGGGYEQANKLKNFILSSEEVTLYKDKVNPFKLYKKNYKKIYTIIITLEQFGPLNINMSPLLSLGEYDEYAWSCNLYDLENLVDMLIYMGRGTKDFINYINWRISRHDKFIASDELEILEVYFSKDRLEENEEYIYVPTLQYNLIDKIYFEKHGLTYKHPNFKTKNIFKKGKIGRNDPCPCGSGNKYKKCCLDN
nr:SEC-C metal-binding domain-containing protein [Clostridium perfringens]